LAKDRYLEQQSSYQCNEIDKFERGIAASELKYALNWSLTLRSARSTFRGSDSKSGANGARIRLASQKTRGEVNVNPSNIARDWLFIENYSSHF